ncbi:MAG: hypothetical protein U0869_04700 [Chloroflexota bacterium]
MQIVSSGGSGNYMVTATVPGVTELRGGGGCLMDRFYAEQCHMTELGFEFAVTIASVAGRPKRPRRAILDSGFETMSDSMALRHAHRPARRSPTSPRAHEPQGRPGCAPLRGDDKVRFIPEYTDTCDVPPTPSWPSATAWWSQSSRRPAASRNPMDTG